MSTHWVFGYGSLMWNPGFAYIRSEAAALIGYRRELCVYSFHYRGTHDNLGLVFGLAAGGQCEGVAFEIAGDVWEATHAYLREREQITMVYDEVVVPVTLKATGESVQAMTYVVNLKHEQCALGLDDQAIADHVRRACGTAGHCIDYVRNTHNHLVKLGIADARLAAIMARLDVVL
jgi:glutathione-specific gamma-glutamylcyclotransferase